ncbi:ATP-binding protein [Pseudolabrys taiwanensis]|uniref:ATP-binding protein n=1 Tax=Pseudolabrys taiwanensis TaxID=331696 RepID=A0A346A1A5_9HYPH|nr:ATP-binding protein [Pseudolabrys taiwanensis]AXK82952.1 ATP-binding protein [Pseudolabrys taiwanensis]
MAPLEIEVLATSEAISALTEKVLAYLEEQQVDSRAAHHVALVVEEIVTNLGTHGNCRDKPAKIRLMVEPAQVTGEIIDTGPPFDLRLAPDPAIEAPLEERPIGGLGLYLIRKLTSTLEYSHQNGQNLTTFAIARS